MAGKKADACTKGTNPTVVSDSTLSINPRCVVTSSQDLAHILVAVTTTSALHSLKQATTVTVSSGTHQQAQTIGTIANVVTSNQRMAGGTIHAQSVPQTSMPQRIVINSGVSDVFLRLSPSTGTSGSSPQFTVLESASGLVPSSDVSLASATVSSTGNMQKVIIPTQGQHLQGTGLPHKAVLTASAHPQIRNGTKRLASVASNTLSFVNNVTDIMSHLAFVNKLLSGLISSDGKIPSIPGSPRQKKMKLDKSHIIKDVDKRKKIADHFARKYFLLKCKYYHQQAEYFFLKSGGNIMDHIVWKKNLPTELLEYLRANKFDLHDDVKVITECLSKWYTIANTASYPLENERNQVERMSHHTNNLDEEDQFLYCDSATEKEISAEALGSVKKYLLTPLSILNLNSVDAEDEFLYGDSILVSIDTGWSEEKNSCDETCQTVLSKFNSRLKKNLSDSQNKVQETTKFLYITRDDIIIKDPSSGISQQRYVLPKLDSDTPILSQETGSSLIRDKSKYHTAEVLKQKRSIEKTNLDNTPSFESEKHPLYPERHRQYSPSPAYSHRDIRSSKKSSDYSRYKEQSPRSRRSRFKSPGYFLSRSKISDKMKSGRSSKKSDYFKYKKKSNYNSYGSLLLNSCGNSSYSSGSVNSTKCADEKKKSKMSSVRKTAKDSNVDEKFESKDSGNRHYLKMPDSAISENVMSDQMSDTLNAKNSYCEMINSPTVISSVTFTAPIMTAAPHLKYGPYIPVPLSNDSQKAVNSAPKSTAATPTSALRPIPVSDDLQESTLKSNKQTSEKNPFYFKENNGTLPFSKQISETTEQNELLIKKKIDPHIHITNRRGPIFDCDEFFLYNSIEIRKLETENTELIYPIFKNESNNCWLNSCLLLMSFNRTFEKIVDSHCDSRILRIIWLYDNFVRILNSSEEALEEIKAKIPEFLKDIQDVYFKNIQKVMKNEHGKPDSAFCALLGFINIDASDLKEKISSTWIWEKHCPCCGKKSKNRLSKPIITLSRVNIFQPETPTSIYTCTCKSQQEMKLLFKEVSPCLIFHFENGAGTGKDFPCIFSIKGQEFHLTSIIIIKSYNNQTINHFITWIRNPHTNMWLNCNDLKTEPASFSAVKPIFDLKNIYICVFETFNNISKVIINENLFDEEQESGNLENSELEIITISDED